AVRQPRPHDRCHFGHRRRPPGFPGCHARARRLRGITHHRGRRRHDARGDWGDRGIPATPPSRPGSGPAAPPQREPPGTEVPAMRTMRLSRRLGLDGNPLRRRTDKIAACAAALLLAAFVIGAPLLSVAAAGWAARSWTAYQQAVRSWRQMPALVLQAAPAPTAAAGVLGSSLVLARWAAPDGRGRTGRIPVRAPMAAGRGGRAGWGVARRGSPPGPRLNNRQARATEVTGAAAASATLGIMLLCLAWAGRRVLDRRRLAAWEAAWAAVGPQWTRRFRSRG